MPTLQQLPQATSIDPTDQLLVEKNGVAFVSDVATLLAQTQPRMTFAPNTLAGRNNSPTAGPPAPIQVGPGLTMQAGDLRVDPTVVAPIMSPSFAGSPSAPTPTTLDSSTALATTAFVQANLALGRPISLTGDVTGAGVGTISTTLATIATPGTYSKVQINAKGQVVSGGQVQAGDVLPLVPLASAVTPGLVQVGTGLTVQAGNLSVDPTIVASINSPALTGTPTAPTRATLDSSTALATTAFVQANVARGQPISLTGDLIGSGVGSISTTLPAISTPGTYTKIQVNAKGQVVSGGQLQAADVVPLLPIATTGSTGLVKVGSGLTIQTDGTINVNSGLKTVQDFGAVGDGVTDDTAAFLAYGNWFRQQRSVNGAQQAWVLGFGRRYIVSDTLDFTRYKYVTFDGQGSQIISNVKGFPVIDALGMDNCIIRDLSIYSGAPSSPALIGLQLGLYIDNQGHPQNSIENLTITGYFSQCCVFNTGSETSIFTSLNLINRYVGSQWCYALIQDATGFWPIVSKYVSVARTPNTAFSFNENSFIEPVLQMTGGGPAVWMAATHRHSYRGGYASVGAGFPAAVLSFLDASGAGHTQSLLEWDVHCEVAPTSTFLLTGYASPQLKGVLVRDHLVQSQNIFATTPDVTSVTITDAILQTPDWFSTIGVTQSVFDTPSKYSVQGEIYLNSQSASVWAAPATFVGSFFTDDATPFVFGVGTAFAQSLTSAKIAGPVTTTGSLVVGGGAVTLASDRINPNLAVGYANSSAASYVDFNGANVSAGYSVRMMMQSAGQLTVTGSGGGGATIDAPGGKYSGQDFVGSGTLSVSQAFVSGPMTAGSLVLTGTVSASQVFAGPLSGGGAPSFRALMATDVAGVETRSNKAVANGYASLDGAAKVPVSQLPTAVLGGMIFQGNWDASANAPSLTSGTGSKGFYYTVSVAGASVLDGITQWSVGDHAAFNGNQWEKFAGAAANVVSVAGRTGIISLTASDISGLSTVATTGRFVDLVGLPVLPGVASAGIVRSDGTSFGTVALGAGLAYGIGTLSAPGLVAANAPVFTASTRRTVGMGLVASGTTQSTAAVLLNDMNEVSTVSSGANSVLLSDPGLGGEIVVRNAQGATALLVYPPVGQSIDIGLTNNPFSMGANSTKVFRKMSTTKWYSQ